MFGAKVSNLLLGEKNFIDHCDKNLGQERERLAGDELEFDDVCVHLRGGSSFLDYPSKITHDFCDITTAIDIYLESFTRNATSKLPPRFGIGIFPRDQIKNERMSKMPFRGDELSERQFVNAFVESSIKIRNHLIDCLQECTESGRLENFYVIISNVAMIRNYIWIFQQIFNVDAKAHEKLKGEYKLHTELLESFSDRLVQCQLNLLTTYVIHDELSQNWGSAQYFEGHRASPTIAMWAYFLKGTRRDMWKIMPPKLSQRIFAILLNDSLAILTGRYSKIDPSEETCQQFCSDIINILETIEELLLSISITLEEFHGDVDPTTSKVIFAIHQKCMCLTTTLILVGTPLEVLYKTFRRGLSFCSLLEKPSADMTNPIWIQVLVTLCAKYHHKVDQLELITNLRLLSAQPAVNWTLVYKAITLNEFHLGSMILEVFHGQTTVPTNFLLEGNGFKRCLNAGCMSSNCHSLPKLIPNFYVSSSVLHILAHTIPRTDLSKIYHRILPQVKEWSAMDRTQVWTSMKRPIWFQSLIDLLLPILKTCVQGLCINLITGKKGEEDTTQFVVELLNSATDLLSIIPRGFFLICEEIDDFIPPMVYPVRNSVPVHFLVTTLYHLLNLCPGIISSVQIILNSGELPLEDVQNILPVLLSTSERLCHLDDSVFDQAIHRLISQIESMMRHSQAELGKRQLEGLESQFVVTDDLAALKVNFLLDEPEGQIALWIVYWFLMTNSEVFQDAISFGRKPSLVKIDKSKEVTGKKMASGPGRNQASKVAPASTTQDERPVLQILSSIKTFPKSLNIIHNFHFVNRRRTFDEILWNYNQHLDWVSTIRDSKMGLDKAAILTQLLRRPEFQSSNDTPTSTTTPTGDDVASEKGILLQKMVTEIKALMSVRTY